MTRAEIRTEIRRLTGDVNSIRFGDAQLNTWIDMGNVDMVTTLDFDTAQATIATVGSNTFASSEPNYQIPANAMNIKEVYLQDENNVETRFDLVDQDELNSLFGSTWRNDASGKPIIAYRADYNVVGLHPRPNATHNNRTLRIFYDRIPSDFSTDTDVPVVIEALHDAISHYAASRGYFQLGDIVRGDYMLKRYETLIKKFRHKTRFANDLNQWRWG